MDLIDMARSPRPTNAAWLGALQDELDQVMTDRLHKFLLAAARYGYRNLVLGAWGCGAFGHDAAAVAGYFYDVFSRRASRNILIPRFSPSCTTRGS